MAPAGKKEVKMMKNFIWNIPDFSWGFQFTTEIVLFFLDIALVCIGICFCIKGYKAFRTLFLCMTAVFLGYLGLRVGDLFTSSRVYKMVLFVVFAFWGVYLVYVTMALISRALKKKNIQAPLVRQLFWITPVLGGFLITAVVYANIYRSNALALLLFVLTVAGGIAWQYAHKNKGKIAHTYDDIVKMKRL